MSSAVPRYLPTNPALKIFAIAKIFSHILHPSPIFFVCRLLRHGTLKSFDRFRSPEFSSYSDYTDFTLYSVYLKFPFHFQNFSSKNPLVYPPLRSRELDSINFYKNLLILTQLSLVFIKSTMYPAHHNRVRSGTREETGISSQHQDRSGSNLLIKIYKRMLTKKLLTLGCRDL
jgi:hypothetical protein